MGFSASYKLAGGYLHTSGGHIASGRLGRTPEPTVSLDLADGTGAEQANQVYSASLSIAASATLLIDLKGGGGELDVLNVALAMTAVKVVILTIDTPASGASLRFGPQGQTNAAQLWFQAATTNFWEQVLDVMVKGDTRAGWALDGTHKVVAINNPGAATVTGKIRIIGTK